VKSSFKSCQNQQVYESLSTSIETVHCHNIHDAGEEETSIYTEGSRHASNIFPSGSRNTWYANKTIRKVAMNCLSPNTGSEVQVCEGNAVQWTGGDG